MAITASWVMDHLDPAGELKRSPILTQEEARQIAEEQFALWEHEGDPITEGSVEELASVLWDEWGVHS